jgi:hypothetical protein
MESLLKITKMKSSRLLKSKLAVMLAWGLSIGFQANAQQEVMYSQYMFNTLAINPSYAGSRDVLSLTALGRYQWIEKVFKVVLAEGYFTEIYDHNSKKDFFGLFKSNKKALVIAKAKVAVGFDFGAMKFRKEEGTRKLIIEEFPPAQIIAIDTDYKFYDINQGFLHKFNNEDYTSILNEAKKLMQEKAFESDLPNIANKQIGLMMNQLAASMNWEIDMKNTLRLLPEPPALPEPPEIKQAED